MSVSVQLIINTKDMQKFNTTGKRIKRGVLKGVKKGMVLFQKEAKKFSGSNQLRIRTGALRDSIDYTVVDSSDMVIGTLGSDKLYAAIHEYGGTIAARNAKHLVFKTPDGWRKVSSVNIPPRPFLRPAIENNKNEVARIINDEILKSFKSNLFGR